MNRYKRFLENISHAYKTIAMTEKINYNLNKRIFINNEPIIAITTPVNNTIKFL